VISPCSEKKKTASTWCWRPLFQCFPEKKSAHSAASSLFFSPRPSYQIFWLISAEQDSRSTYYSFAWHFKQTFPPLPFSKAFQVSTHANEHKVRSFTKKKMKEWVLKPPFRGGVMRAFEKAKVVCA
jgi:hypothetical protein